MKPLFVSGVFVSNAGLARVKPGNGTRPGGNVREDVGYEDDDFYSDGRPPSPAPGCRSIRTMMQPQPGPNAATSARRSLPAGSFTSGAQGARSSLKCSLSCTNVGAPGRIRTCRVAFAPNWRYQRKYTSELRRHRSSL